MEELILEERETREKIAEILNNSKLPGMCLRIILKDFLEVAKILEEQQYQQAKATLNQQEEKEVEDKDEKGRNDNS